MYRDGKRLEGREAEEALARHNAVLERHRNAGAVAQPVARSGGGGKGGNRDIDVRGESGQQHLKEMQAKYNTDNSYGYYNNVGQYIPFSVDIRDGGGMNTSGNFFKGAGPLSTALNVAKVRPAGPAREKDASGNFIVPREQIGFRDATDMTDRGGPQASGGQYQGAGTVSTIFNMLDVLGGADIPERQEYVYDENGNFVPRQIKLLGG
tara:strand:- start:282 stop:905 length:624 start_codon:yes stop_codon:yes gene_type:complete